MSKKEEKPGEQKNESESNWKHAIYNPNTGEFVGRTASSWGLILLFYLVFYGFLAGMFTLTMWALLQTLDDNVPKYSDRVPSPGLVIRPSSMEIVYNRSDPLQYQQHVEHLETLLQQYNDTEQVKNELCLAGQYYEQDGSDEKKVCQFRRSSLGFCSGLTDSSYGYREGQPCIIVKMNRIIGLKPSGDPFINCTAKGESQVQVQYFPQEGRIDRMYFPYYGKKAHVGYVQPLVGVKLMLRKEDYSKELMVECRVEGSNLKNNDERDKFLGRVSFRVLVTE
ncbi:sodium/potassium-transporting ATPase subunit beta-3a [Astyanax mexicanus]|uniref:sodium/potassium-transporting ATPase subunit beta-3a n=1 Tax=Astyanax mexicanus TaxID=7994 RepID=UPI0020CB515C|nr:sodium/potassium-transporting ATPase subunit beta-3a [Astyanax mexicanus]